MSAPESTQGRRDDFQKLQRAGQQALVYTFSLMKTGEIHDVNNDAYERPIEKLLEALDVLIELEQQAITLVVRESIAQVNSHALWMDPGTQEQARELEGWLARREAGGIKFKRRPEPEQLRRFFHLFARFVPAGGAGDPMEALAKALEAEGIVDLELAPQPMRLEGVGAGVRGVASLWYYAKAVAGLTYILPRHPTLTRPAERLGQELVDACATEQDLLIALPYLGLTGARSVARRSVDAGVLCAAVGRGLGLSPRHCAELATAALLQSADGQAPCEHPEDFTPDERCTALSVQQLLDLAADTLVSAELARRVSVGVEHALGPKGEGPPYLAGPPAISPNGQVIVLANHWLRLVAGDGGEGGEGGARSPIEALGRLLAAPPPHVDPDLVRVFAAVVGPLPVGTLVELAGGGELAVVSEVEHITGRGVYRASPPAVSGPRTIRLVRLQTREGKAVSERRAGMVLEDLSQIARTLRPCEALRPLVVRGVLGRPSAVAAQMGLRGARPAE